ncbi:MAG: DUF6468 domain-containing protein [Rhodovarius sp.]|nr:DUF6468 domain-containing protein [Rhodovarius sp.]
MTAVEWAAQLLVLLLLGLALPLAWRLNASLMRLRSEREEMGQAAERLAEATRAAEAALVRLRASTELAGRQLAERMAAAEPLREDLRFLIERGEALADRLEAAERAARPVATEPRPAPTDPRSSAERSLLQALSARS